MGDIVGPQALQQLIGKVRLVRDEIGCQGAVMIGTQQYFVARLQRTLAGGN